MRQFIRGSIYQLSSAQGKQAIRLRGRATSQLTRYKPLVQAIAQWEFKQEALKHWTAYQETGRHLAGQEASDWLSMGYG